MRSMKLATRMAFGFGVMIVIVLALGGLALWNAYKMQYQSDRMISQFMPEVEISGDMERHALLTMYYMRGYALSAEEHYLNEGRKNLALTKDHIGKAKALADKYTDLVKLREEIDKARQKADMYEKLVADTVSINGVIDFDRKLMDEAASKLMKNAYDYLGSQTELIKGEIGSGSDSSRITQRVAKITLANDVIDLVNAARIANFKAQAQRNPDMLQDGLKLFTEIDTKLDQLKGMTSQEIHLRAIASVRDAAHAYQGSMQELRKNWTELGQLNKSRQATADDLLESAKKNADTGRQRATETIKEAVSSVSFILGIGLIVAVVVGIITAVIMTLSITRPVRQVMEGLGESADQVASASGQVASSSQQLAEGASQQAAAIEETSSSLEEISAMTRQNAHNANEADRIVKDSGKDMEKASHAMSELTSSMSRISRASEETSKIIKTIDEIAFQTNLLALNAAVEAARAGEAGAGFAVVADEVRSLALRAAEAAKTTAELIEGTVKTVHSGSEIVEKANAAFAKVAEGARKTGELVGEISAASNEQAQGIDQLNRAITEMDKVTQQNAATAEESASASEEMSAQAEQMNVFVSRLAVLVNGGAQARDKDEPPQKAARLVALRVRPGKSSAPSRANGGNGGAGSFQKVFQRGPDKAGAIRRSLKMPGGGSSPSASSRQLLPMEQSEAEDF